MMTLDDAYALMMDEERERSCLITDPHQPDNPIVFVTRAFCRQTGYTPEEVMGRNCRFMQGPDTDPEAVSRIREAIDRLEPITIDILNYAKDGTPFWNRLRIRPSFDEHGRLQNFVGIQNPVAESEVRSYDLRDIVE